MSHKRNENFIVLLALLSSIGITVESILLKWEFWVPPIIVIASILLWVANLLGKPDYTVRRILYFVYALFVVFFHGVHMTSFFDSTLVVALVMISYSFLRQMYMLHLFLAEYVVILTIQFFLLRSDENFVLDSLTVSRVILHVAIIFFVYLSCTKIVRDHTANEEIVADKDDRIEKYEEDMEDFLSNISHELRTPVNVVNGMSELLIKKNNGTEAYSIKDAGIRLAYQIEDIQDYTECKRNKVILEEEDYMSTSVLNDVVSSFRLMDNSNGLHLVADLDPAVPNMLRGDIKKLHKIFRHLLENAMKFTKSGGIYVRMYSEDTDYGVNLCIEMTDTGIGMDRKTLDSLSEGMFQADKKRNRNAGGIGLGLYIVFGFAHRMGGFVKIESEPGAGTTVRVTIPQKVVDEARCIQLSPSFKGDIVFHVRSDKFKVPKVRDFYRSMALNLAAGIHVPLYSAETKKDVERFVEKLDVSYVFMGQEEYEDDPEYFDRLSMGDIIVGVSAGMDFRPRYGSRVMIMPRPLYGYPVMKLLNEGRGATHMDFTEDVVKPVMKNVRALIVDDEPMNLVVARSLFADYDMDIDTAESGREGVDKFTDGDYDIVFMDHMMPEMDGVEAMKLIKKAGEKQGKPAVVVALTANAVSGAREMFMKEGFDGFIAKPINVTDFERVMIQVLPESKIEKGGAYR